MLGSAGTLWGHRGTASSGCPPCPAPSRAVPPRGPLAADTGWHSHALARELPAGLFRRKPQRLRGGEEDLLPSPGQPAAPGVPGIPGLPGVRGRCAPRARPWLCPVGRQPWGPLGGCSLFPKHHQILHSPAAAAQRWAVAVSPHPSPQPLPAGGALGELRLSRTRCHPAVPTQHHPVCWDLQPPDPTPRPRSGPHTQGTGWELQHIIY